MKNLSIALSLFVTTAFAQDLPLSFDYILLGDTITQSSQCPGCGSVTPKKKDDDGAWVNAPVATLQIPPTFFSVTPSNGMTWTVSLDATTGAGGFGLALDKINISQKAGDCVFSDATNKCKNGKTCKEKYGLVFSAYCLPGGVLSVAGAEIEITIPGHGTLSMKPLASGVVDPNTGLLKYGCYLSFEQEPGCGQSKELELDPSTMDPTSGAFTHQWNQSTHTLTLKATCAICPETPAY